MVNPFVRTHAVFARKGLYSFLWRKAMEVPEGASVLNVGAGGAFGDVIKQAMKKKNFSTTSIDVDPDRQPDIVGDIISHDFKQESYDTIFMLEVLEHIPDPHLVPEKLNKILKPGGTVVLSTPFIFPIHDKPHDYYRFTHYGLMHLFRNFDDVQIQARNSWAETINVLRMRLCREKNIALQAWGYFMVLTGVIISPISLAFGKLMPSDTMTTGYILTAQKSRG